MAADQSSSGTCSAACAVSGHLDTRTAATEVAHELHDTLGGACHLAVVFASFHHRAALPEAVDTIRKTIDPGTTMAVTAEAVLGGTEELEGVAGLSAIALHMPGVVVSPWMSTPDAPVRLRQREAVAERINLTHDLRAVIFFGEPFSTPITRLLPALTECGGPDQPVRVTGGMASGASQPGHNLLVLDDRVFPGGAIGVSIAGDIEIDFVVSQGCRPIGQPLVITKATKNCVLELGGQPAVKVLQELSSSLSDEERALLGKGLLLGHVIDEHKRPFGRGDFLVRNLLGIDKKQGGIIVGDNPRPGQTVQFHARDAVTAAEDLQLLLDAQQLHEDPFGAMLFTCNGRGQRLFGAPNHDLAIIAERLGEVPIAGFFAAGEIGPIGDRSFLHGHTASLAILRGTK